MTDDLPREPRRVRATYDEIAEHFSKTRHAPWPEVEAFVADAPRGGVGLDVGCGNGRHLSVLAATVDRAVGLDLSRGLLAEARERVGDRSRLVHADAAALPIAGDAVDLGLSIATVHHLPDRRTRVGSLRELGRVLAPGGRALVSAWSTTHDRFDRTEGFDTTVDWTLPDGTTVPRFYHVYAPEEFADDVAAAGLDARRLYVASGNCYAAVRA